MRHLRRAWHQASRETVQGGSAMSTPTPRHRGAEIRTRDLTDPNGARYQAAPRPGAGDYRRRESRRAQYASNATSRRIHAVMASTSTS